MFTYLLVKEKIIIVLNVNKNRSNDHCTVTLFSEYTISQHHMHLLLAWTVLKSTISHQVIPVLAEDCHFGHFAIMPQICHKLLPILQA